MNPRQTEKIINATKVFIWAEAAAGLLLALLVLARFVLEITGRTVGESAGDLVR